MSTTFWLGGPAFVYGAQPTTAYAPAYVPTPAWPDHSLVPVLSDTVARLQGQNLALAAMVMAVANMLQGSQRARLGQDFKRMCDQARPDEFSGVRPETHRSFDAIARVLADIFSAR